MTAKTPDPIARAAVVTGATKAATSWDKTLLASFLAGAYLSFGAMVAVTVSPGLDPELWGTLPTLFTGIAFTLGLVLVLVAGSSLLTGNMLLVPISALAGRIPVRDVAPQPGAGAARQRRQGRCAWPPSSPSRPVSSPAPARRRARRRR